MKKIAPTRYFEEDGFPVLLNIGRGHIYAIECQGPEDDRPIKIGITDGSPLGRLGSMQTGCPYPLKLLGVLTNKLDEDEARIHLWLLDDLIHGEWFRNLDRMKILSSRLTSYQRPERSPKLIIRRNESTDSGEYIVSCGDGPAVYYAPNIDAARRFVICSQGLSANEIRDLGVERG